MQWKNILSVRVGAANSDSPNGKPICARTNARLGQFGPSLSAAAVGPLTMASNCRWPVRIAPALARPSELARLALQVGLFLLLSAGLDVSDACCHGGVHSAWPSCGAGRVSCGGPISERRNLDDRSTAAVSGAARPVMSRSLRPKCGDRFIPENRCLCCYSVSGPPLVMLPLLAGQGGGGGGGDSRARSGRPRAAPAVPSVTGASRPSKLWKLPAAPRRLLKRRQQNPVS